MLKLLEKGGKPIRKANGYYGSQIDDHGERRAQALIKAGLEVYGMSIEELQAQRKGDWRKALLAAMIQSETTMRLDLIREELLMGAPTDVSRLAKEARKTWLTSKNGSSPRG